MAVNLSRALQQIFDVATAWKAIVLITEVGTFLTELLDYVLLMISFFRLMFSLSRDRLHDLERNTMVAVLYVRNNSIWPTRGLYSDPFSLLLRLRASSTIVVSSSSPPVMSRHLTKPSSPAYPRSVPFPWSYSRIQRTSLESFHLQDRSCFFNHARADFYIGKEEY